MYLIRPATVSKMLHSRGIALVVWLCVLGALWMVFSVGDYLPIRGDSGFALLSANEWLPRGRGNFIAAMAVNLSLGAVLLAINRFFNILRSMTALYLTLLAVMLLSTPGLAVQLYTGPVLALALGCALLLLFDSYGGYYREYRVFLVMAVFSFLTATQYCFALYIPALVIACRQMRILNGRSAVAALLGIITPWWILFGFGFISPPDIELPHFRSLFGVLDFTGTLLLLADTGFTVLLLITVMALNFFTTIAYNARNRAMNGAVTVVALFTVAGMVLDFNNAVSYLPSLYCCTALQAAHYFTAHRHENSFIAILAIMLVYIVFFVCQTAI